MLETHIQERQVTAGHAETSFSASGFLLQQIAYCKEVGVPEISESGQQVNDLVPGWQGAQALRRTALNGRFCRLEPLDVDRHTADLFTAYALDDNSDQTRLASTRPESVAVIAHWITGKVNDDALVSYAVANPRSEQAVGIVSYMAIKRKMDTVEIGHVTWS